MFAEESFIKEIFPFQIVIIDWDDGHKLKIGMNA